MEIGVGNPLQKQNRRRPKRHSTGSTRSKSVKRNSNPDSMYLVEDIIDERVYKGQKQYRVRWQGFPPDQDSWEPYRNLTNVLDIIEDFHRRSNTANTSKVCEAVKPFSTSHTSPASVPTPPSTPGSSSANVSKRSRGGSEEPGESGLPKRKARITGRFVYVPKNQLVASKTKYFDDIRDGKIDLSQNDLYSRVKTRRRAAETSSDSVNDGENEGDSVSFYQMTHEPNSPVSDCLHHMDSFSEFHSGIASVESEHLKSSRREQFGQASGISQPRSLPDMVNPTLMDGFEESNRNNTTENINEIYYRPVNATCNRNLSCTSRAAIPENVVPEITTNITASPSRGLSIDDVAINSSHLVSSSPVNTDKRLSSSSVKKVVTSLRDLVATYFRLLFGNLQNPPTSTPGLETDSPEEVEPTSQKAAELLDSLPRLVPYSPLARIQTHQELLEAINNQRWTLLASVQTENRVEPVNPTTLQLSAGRQSPGSLDQILQHEFPSEVDRTNAVRQVVLAVIVGGAGRPIILESLLASGLDPDTVVNYDAGGQMNSGSLTGSVRDEQAVWPLLSLAVHLGRLHAAQALLQAGAQPNCTVKFRDQEGATRPRRTALGLAIAAGDVDMASMLLLSGANFYEVEPGTTALNLIKRLISQHSSGNPSNLESLSSQSDGVDPVLLAELHDRMRSIDSYLPAVPVPSPPEGSEVPSLPKSVLLTAVLSSASRRSAACEEAASTGSDATSPLLLPSVDSLNRLYHVVAVHHARLSVSVTRLVRRWLTRAGLVQTALVSPCKWISIRQRTVVVDFSWPIANLNALASTNPQLNTGPITPLLVLVHGRVAPPACYDVWMDDDGPCLIDRVRLDDVHLQRPLGRVPFVTTLYPVRQRMREGSEPKSHKVTVDFSHRVSTARSLTPTCFAIMIIAVRLDDPPSSSNRCSPGNRSQQVASTSHRGTSSTRASASTFHSPQPPSQSRHRSFL